MAALAGNAVLWLIIGLAVGWLIAWVWRSRTMRTSLNSLQNESRAKHEQLKRDLEGRVGRLENELLKSKDVIQTRDAAIAERDRLIRQQTEQLTDISSQVARLTVESADRQAKLDDREASYSKLEQEHLAARTLIGDHEKRIAEDGVTLTQLSPVPAKLADTEAALGQTLKNLESAQARANAQDQEISRLHKRSVELEPLTVAVKARDAKVQELEGRLAEAVRIRDGEIVQLKKRVGELEALPQRLKETEAKRTHLAAEVDTLRRAKDEEIEALQQELKTIDVLRQRLLERDARSLQTQEREILAVRAGDLLKASIRAELAATRHELIQRNAILIEKDTVLGRLHRQVAELEPLVDGVAAHSARALELERGIAQREHRLRQATHEVADLRADLLRWLRLAGALPAREAEIARLRAQLQATASTKPALTNKKPNKDDLKRIHGIGPALEKLLHKEGIVSFKQIAEWSEADVNAIAGKLGAFSNRIVRDDWIAHAKAQHLNKYGERLS
jgi:predicted flap endonuclease-1-like 5' DNA nuclease